DGALYGTTFSGLTNTPQNGAWWAMRSVFRLNTNGSLQSLRDLGIRPGVVDGNQQAAGLMQGLDGTLYGTFTQGDPYGGSNGDGRIFKIGPDGAGYASLYEFSGSIQEDGHYPHGRILQGRDGVLYGTTQFGGGSDSGTIFKLNTNGTSSTNIWS